MRRSPAVRTVVKTVSYKIIALLELALLAWILTGSVELATKVGFLHLSVSALTYAAFDHGFETVWQWFLGGGR